MSDNELGENIVSCVQRKRTLKKYYVQKVITFSTLETVWKTSSGAFRATYRILYKFIFRHWKTNNALIPNNRQGKA